jgi:hypothetical protein
LFFEPVPKLTVVLLSKKLTLKEGKLAKQIKCRSRKAKSPIRILRSGSKTTSLDNDLDRAASPGMGGAAFGRRRVRLPRITTGFEINVNAEPQGLSKNG